MNRNGILAASFVTLMVFPATSEEIQSEDLFRLFNACKPIGLQVGLVSDDLLELGISKADIREAVENRLRVARLYTSSALTSLHVAVSRFRIQLEYRKPVRDLITRETRQVPTFTKTARVNDHEKASVMLELSKVLDHFLVEYLKVNESACGSANAHLSSDEIIDDSRSASDVQPTEQTPFEHSSPTARDSSSTNLSGIALNPYVIATLADQELQPVVSSNSIDTEVWASIFSKARELVLVRTRTLPDFLCEVVVRRLAGDVEKERIRWREAVPEMLVGVRYVNGSDDYTVISVEGETRHQLSFKSNHGLTARGEFGGVLNTLTSRSIKSKWVESARLGQNLVDIFSVEFPTGTGLIIERGGYPGGPVSTQGFVLIEKTTLQPLGIILRAVKIPDSYGIDDSFQSVFFGRVTIDGEQYLMPLASEAITYNHQAEVMRQSSRYQNYRKFDVESGIRFDQVGSSTQLP